MTWDTTRAGVDATVMQDNPEQNYAGNTRLRVQPAEHESFIRLKSPAARLASVPYAEIVLTQDGAVAGPVTLEVQQLTAGSDFKEKQVKWSNRPTGVKGAAVPLTKNDPADLTEWVFPVTAIYQAIANGDVNNGVRLRSTSGALIKFYGLDASKNRPYLRVQWSTGPQKPVALKPSYANVSLDKWVQGCDYTDRSGDDSCTAVQVQIDPANAFAGAQWDSGEVASDLPMLDLATTTYPGLANNASTWVRMRVQDDTGKWSPYSDAVKITRKVKSGLALNAPALSTTATNLYTNPGAETNLTSLNKAGVATGTLTRDTTAGRFRSGTASARIDITVAGSVGFTRAPSAPITTAGKVVMWSEWVRPDADSTVRPYWEGTVTSTAAFKNGYGDAGAGTLCKAGVWTLVSGTYTVAADTTVSKIGWLLTGNAPVGWGANSDDGIAVVDMDYLPAAFSGDTPDTTIEDYTWSGAANASTSIKKEVLVTEFTPPIIWTFSGTQRAWRVRVVALDQKRKVLADSGKQKGTGNSWTIPKNVLSTGRDFRLILWVWDDQEREESAGDTAYVELVKDFRLILDNTVAGPTTVVAAQVGTTPVVGITITRNAAPDSWTLTRKEVGMDGREYAVHVDLDVVENLTGPLTWKVYDHTARPGVSYEYRARAKVNGKLSKTEGQVGTATTKVSGIWLWDSDGPLGEYVVLGGKSFTVDMADRSGTFYGQGSLEVIRSITGQNGLSGECSDLFIRTRDGRTWRDYEVQMFDFKDRPTGKFRMCMGTTNIPVLLGDITVGDHPESRPGLGSVLLGASFKFWQRGEHQFGKVA